MKGEDTGLLFSHNVVRSIANTYHIVPVYIGTPELIERSVPQVIMIVVKGRISPPLSHFGAPCLSCLLPPSLTSLTALTALTHSLTRSLAVTASLTISC